MTDIAKKISELAHIDSATFHIHQVNNEHITKFVDKYLDGYEIKQDFKLPSNWGYYIDYDNRTITIPQLSYECTFVLLLDAFFHETLHKFPGSCFIEEVLYLSLTRDYICHALGLPLCQFDALLEKAPSVSKYLDNHSIECMLVDAKMFAHEIFIKAGLDAND